MRILTRCFLVGLSAFSALMLSAQEAVPPAGEEPLTTEEVAAPTSERRDNFPELNLYLPEMQLDIRVRKLIRNVLFEGQVDYEFIDGDISTFLRYKYYAKNFTYKVGVFDSVRFDSVESGSGDFDRVRGGLLLFEYPENYNSRYFFLTQFDALTFGDVDNPDNNKHNFYSKVAWQFGTPFDQRLNAIVGESRGRVPPVLTAYREIGPQKLGLAVAITRSFSALDGDYDYTKFETEGLKRWDLGARTFLISRLHAGTMLQKERVTEDPAVPEVNQWSIPEYELFKIGGREAMKGADDHERGTDEVHLINEYFAPIFRERDYKTGPLRWHNMYGILYSGAGSLGYGSGVFNGLDEIVVDAGLGFEAELSVREYEVYLTAVYAQTIEAPEALEGSEIRVSVRTAR